MSEKELQPREKMELPQEGEETRPGPVFVPAVDIFESGDEITLLADMPGVKGDNVSVDLEKDQLTITGRVEPETQTGETFILKEYDTGTYRRGFTLSEHIDREKITATMDQGVLRLVLPKAQKAEPRKIEVRTA